MIHLTDISFSYPNADFCLQLDELSFSAGSKTAIIGPSGFGKTTLLNLISGIYTPQNGAVAIEGKNINNLTETERRSFRLTNIGFVFQDFNLLDYLTAIDNILLPYRINTVLKLNNEARKQAKEIASMLHIEKKLNKYPSKLSQGERQRVAICRALVHNPSIILADEPTGNLDPENRDIIMHILFEYVNIKGSTLITVTHDHELLPGFDRIVDFKKIVKNS